MKQRGKRRKRYREDQGFSLFPFVFTACLVLFVTGILLILKTVGTFR